MSRWGRKDGLIVSVADHKDDRYGAGWKKLADGETVAPPRRARQQHDEPTPSGQIRRPTSEETPTGQIRRQQAAAAAADPFRNS